jgi:hypothetical protein
MRLRDVEAFRARTFQEAFANFPLCRQSVIIDDWRATELLCHPWMATFRYTN